MAPPGLCTSSTAYNDNAFGEISCFVIISSILSCKVIDYYKNINKYSKT